MADPLESLVSDTLTTLGFELVECRRAGSPQRPLLQVRIDLPSTNGEAGVSSDDCVRASRALEQALEERGLVGPAYTLEVSSPGSDRPLRTAADWARFRGERVKVKHRDFGGTRFGVVEAQGRTDAEAQGTTVEIRLEDGGELLALSLEGMKEARLAPKFEIPGKPGKKKRE